MLPSPGFCYHADPLNRSRALADATPDALMNRVFRQRGLRWQFLLAMSEFALLIGCVYLAVAVRYWADAGARMRFVGAIEWRAPLVPVVLIIAMAALGLYGSYLRTSWVGRLVRQGVAFLLGWIALTFIYYALPAAFLGRGVLVLALLFGYAAVMLWQAVFLRLADADQFKRSVVMLGAGARAADVYHGLFANTDRCGFRLLGHLPLGTGPVDVPEATLLKPEGALADWLLAQGVDELVVVPDAGSTPLPINDLLDCKQRGVRVTELAEFIEREAGTIRMDLAAPTWLLFAQGFNVSPGRRAGKRAFDVLVAAVILLFAWPFMLLTALAIAVESGFRAPVLYRQERTGEHGKPFHLVKFRSMRVDAEGDGVARWATPGDDRVTPVGRFIRKTRLDEFPQLWNVLAGEMSIIGPRPERPQFVRELSQCIGFYPLRHCMKPGLTGWAQLRYPYGASVADAEEKLKYDLFYVKNHNFMFDLAILIQTVEVVLFGRGAR